MATIVHSIAQSAMPATPGERRLEARLSTLLDPEAAVWYNVPIGRARRYPDFVIMHPARGILVLEVKDWKASDIRRIDKLRWEVWRGNAPRMETSPLEQARHCLLELVDQLRTDPQLCESSRPYLGKLAFSYGWGVVLPNITRKQWNELLTKEEQELVLPGRRLICKDEMTESADAMVFQEQLWGMFEYRLAQRMTATQMDRVRWHLFPEIRIGQTFQQELFVDEAAPNLIKVLDLQQEQLARNLGAGHRVIHGVAGSGKTLILGFRCIQLAQALSKPALVLCYNISLAAKLRSYIESRGIQDKVHVYHFHGWCAEMLRANGLDVAAGDGKFWDRQVASVIAGIETERIPTGQYGAVLIDEGHDFPAEWLRVAVRMADPATDSFLLLYDDAQSIYGAAKRRAFSLSSVGIKASGRTTILRLNYRNSREILRYSYDFARGALSPTVADDDHIPLIEPESGGDSGPPPVLKCFASFDLEIDYALRCILFWMERGIPASEIAIIYFRNRQGSAISQYLQRNGVKHLWMGNKCNKRRYSASEDQITVIPGPSSKGLEFQAVVIVGLGEMQRPNVPSADITRLLYVAMTRARRQLVLTTSSHTQMVQQLMNAVPMREAA